MTPIEKRVKFDFEIYFTNGGNIKGTDFRLDIKGDDISDKELGDYIVEDMRLLMVGETRIINKEIFKEKHKRKPINAATLQPRYIDLSHSIRSGMITYKGLPSPTFTKFLSREESRSIYEGGTEFRSTTFQWYQAQGLTSIVLFIVTQLARTLPPFLWKISLPLKRLSYEFLFTKQRR